MTFTVTDEAVGPHGAGRGASLDHERLVLEARNVAFDWSKLPFHYVPGEPFATHVLNVSHLLLPAGEEFFVELFKKALPLIKDGGPLRFVRVIAAYYKPSFHPSGLGGVERAVGCLAVSPAARAARRSRTCSEDQ